MLSYKLQKIKKYLEKNLKKKFITFSKAFFASSILFIKKKDDSLRFCMNYWKLNALIKRNCYSIFLINEVLTWIQDSKYLTRLNIIITFNKLRMSSESENLLRAYQGWIELASVSSSDLAQSLFSFINISLFNIIFLSTSHSTRVTNTFPSSLAQPLNIT